jgi:hypothetical protein
LCSLVVWSAFLSWLEERVSFHTTMVDRITSQRAGDPDVPRAEPLPKKALVIEDLKQASRTRDGSRVDGGWWALSRHRVCPLWGGCSRSCIWT